MVLRKRNIFWLHATIRWRCKVHDVKLTFSHSSFIITLFLVSRAVVLFDQGFDVSTGMYSTGMRNGMQIITNNRHMILKCWTRRKSKEWMNHLKDAANGSGKY